MSVDRRLAALQRQLGESALEQSAVERVDTSASFDLGAMNVLLTPDHRDMRKRVAKFIMSDPLFDPRFDMALKDFRALTTQRVKRLLDQKFFSVSDYKNDIARFLAGLESCGVADYSMSIKMGVHMVLCGGTIATLGNARHHAEYFPRMDTLDLPGCFAMTEVGHGSNVVGIRTTAVYDKARGGFVVHTPDDDASKFWIGGSAQSAKISTVFVQLSVDGVERGVHVLVVRLRDDAGRLCPGVSIKDNGTKMGLNGVDNGQIWFDNVFVPRENLLDRFGAVSADGVYSSPLPTPEARFGATVGGLTTGRVTLAVSAVSACKLALTIALRYSASRTQFGDTVILDYATQRRRLLVPLAEVYAYSFAIQRLKKAFPDRFASKAAAKEVHLLSSGIKAAATWSRVRILQECRESCGGQGVLSANRIGPLIYDMNVDVTFEGDNHVLMQQVARDLVASAASGRGVPPAAPARAGGPSAPVRPADVGALLKWREDALTARLVAALAKHSGEGSRAAWDGATDLAAQLGWAWSENIAYGEISAAIERAQPSLKAPLTLLRDLYGLSRIENNVADFALAGVIDATGAAALRESVAAILQQLAGDGAKLALDLVAAFGIPDALIRSPINDGWRTSFTKERKLY